MISVALCTWNGERFLRPFLDSLVGQRSPPLELVIGDDASTDGTWTILEDFAANAPFKVELHRNRERLGVVANFQATTARCRGTLTAFADQDDVWLPDKLARAEAAFAGAVEPDKTLYCSRLTYIDASGATVGQSRIPRQIGLHNALVENIATGCTVVMGTSLKTRFLAASPDLMAMHDWWLYLLASSFGEVIFDPEPQVRYRQHTANVAGWQPRLTRWRMRLGTTLARVRSGERGTTSLNQAARFVRAYSDCPAAVRQIVEGLLATRERSLWMRLLCARNPGVARNDPIENLALRLMIILGIH